jgi:hypothetical protein
MRALENDSGDIDEKIKIILNSKYSQAYCSFIISPSFSIIVTLSPAQMEGQSLTVFENRVLRTF